MQVDYDDIVNGNGEWRNIQAVLRNAIFGNASDLFQVKNEVAGIADRLQAAEGFLSNFGTGQKTVQAAVDKMQSVVQKMQADQEEASLQMQYQMKTLREETANRLQQQQAEQQAQMKDLEQRLQKQISENGTLCAHLKERDAAKDAEIQALKQELKDLKESAKATKAALDDAIGRLSAAEKNVSSLQTKFPAALQQLEKNITQLLTENYMSAGQVQGHVQEVIKPLCSKSAVQQIGSKLNERIEVVATQVSQLGEGQLGLENRLASAQKERQQLQASTQQMQAQIDQTRRAFDAQDGRMQALTKTLGALEDTQQRCVQLNALENMQASFAGQIKTQENTIIELLDAMERRVSKQFERDAAALVAAEARRAARAESELSEKKLKGILDTSVSALKDEALKAIKNALGTEDGLEKIKAEYKELRETIQATRTQMASDFRAAIQDADTARSDELNRLESTLEQIQEVGLEREQKTMARMREMDALLQAEALGTGCRMTGSWTWRTRRLSKNQTIIWSDEEQNNNPAGLIWEKGKSSILAVQAGCYRMEFAVFGKTRPTVQLIINNEPILTALGNAMTNAVYTQPKGPANGCFYGQTHTDYIYLAQHSVIQLGLASEFANCVSGYLNIQKVW